MHAAEAFDTHIPPKSEFFPNHKEWSSKIKRLHHELNQQAILHFGLDPTQIETLFELLTDLNAITNQEYLDDEIQALNEEIASFEHNDDVTLAVTHLPRDHRLVITQKESYTPPGAPQQALTTHTHENSRRNTFIYLSGGWSHLDLLAGSISAQNSEDGWFSLATPRKNGLVAPYISININTSEVNDPENPSAADSCIALCFADEDRANPERIPSGLDFLDSQSRLGIRAQYHLDSGGLYAFHVSIEKAEHPQANWVVFDSEVGEWQIISNEIDDYYHDIPPNAITVNQTSTGIDIIRQDTDGQNVRETIPLTIDIPEIMTQAHEFITQNLPQIVEHS